VRVALPMLLYLISAVCKMTTHEIAIDDEMMPNITRKLIHDPNAFLRELVSNSMDANKKLVMAAKQSDIDTNKDIILTLKDNVFTISDNGIGMNKDELVSYIGTMGGSGTRALGDSKNFVGKFGVGFYSVFVVADEVRVITKKYGENETYELVLKNGQKTYTIDTIDDRGECGTTVQLKLSEAFATGLDEDELKKWMKQNLLEDPLRNYTIRMCTDRKKADTKKEKSDDDEKDADKEPEKDAEEHKKVELFPWITSLDEKKLEDYYKSIDGPGKILTSNKMRVTVAQKDMDGKYQDVSFELLVVIPEFLDLRVLGMETKGKHYLFVNNQRVDLEPIPAFLGPITFILKSSEAFLVSTREKLLNSKDTCTALYNSIQKKVLQLIRAEMKKDLKKVMKVYDFYIKTGYVESKKDNKSSLAELFAAVLPFNTSDGLIMLQDFVDKLGADEDILYASIGHDTLDLPEGVYNPLFDGIKSPFILVSGLLEEQVVSMFEYKGKKMVNIVNKEFKNKEPANDDGFIAFCKRELKGVVDDVVMSVRLVNAPFFLKAKNAQFSQAHKHVIGEYTIKNSAFKKTIETDIVLEVNTDSDEVKSIKELISNDYDRAVAALRAGVMAAGVICNMVYNNTTVAFLNLINVQRNLLGMENVPIVVKEDDFDMEKEKKKTKNEIDGIKESVRGQDDESVDEGDFGRIEDDHNITDTDEISIRKRWLKRRLKTKRRRLSSRLLLMMGQQKPGLMLVVRVLERNLYLPPGMSFNTK
ncbi:Molecular chaperone (HSP90 family), partial [Trachipleistophora hominis]